MDEGGRRRKGETDLSGDAPPRNGHSFLVEPSGPCKLDTLVAVPLGRVRLPPSGYARSVAFRGDVVLRRVGVLRLLKRVEVALGVGRGGEGVGLVRVLVMVGVAALLCSLVIRH